MTQTTTVTCDGCGAEIDWANEPYTSVIAHELDPTAGTPEATVTRDYHPEHVPAPVAAELKAGAS